MRVNISPIQFIQTIIRPANDALGLSGFNAEKIMLGTAVNESRLRNIRQFGGPALGYFQDEPGDHDDLWKNWLSSHSIIKKKLLTLLPEHVNPSANCLIDYPIYAAAICRLHYYRIPKLIPDDLDGQAEYYKQYYNTSKGAATVQGYINNWNSFIGENNFLNWTEYLKG